MGARHRSRSRSRGRDKHRERDRRDQRSRSRHRRDRSRPRPSTSHSHSKRSRSSSWHRSRSRSPLAAGSAGGGGGGVGGSSSRHHTHHRHSRRDNYCSDRVNRPSPSSTTKIVDATANAGNGSEIAASSAGAVVSATLAASASANFDLNESDKLLMETLKTIEAVKASNLLKAAKAAEEAERNMTPEEREREERRKKRKSRWNGSEHDKTFIPGMPTTLPCTLNKEQEQAYLYQLQIEDISRKLRSGDLGIPINLEERSPSPEPIYSSDGKRLNTREFRVRKRLEEERHSLILKMQTINPEFKPPLDYKPPVIKVNDKVMIPQEEYPDINFVGLLIGPRGNTLKNMERDTGAKIIIRGKGSIKEGKVGRKDGQPLPGEDEPLHAYITGMNAEAVKKAVDKVKEVIKQGIEVPENQNDLRRMQLRELAQLNGTLREGDGMRCSNCAATDHKTWQCPDKPNVTNTIMCTNCGSVGHIAKDCRTKTSPTTAKEKTKIDEEYMHLMAELGEATAPMTMTTSSSTSNSNQNVFETSSSQTKGPMKALMAPTSQSFAQPTSPGGSGGSGSGGGGVGGWPPMTPSTKNMPQPLMQHLQPPPPSLVHQHYNHHLGPQSQSSPSLPQHHFAQNHQWPPPPPPPPPLQPQSSSSQASSCQNSWLSSSATAGIGSNANAQPPLPPGSCHYANPYLNQKNSPKTIPTTAPWPPPHAMSSSVVHPPPPPPPISTAPPSNAIPPLPPYNWSTMSASPSLLPPPPPGLDMNILLAAPPPPPPPPPPPATV